MGNIYTVGPDEVLIISGGCWGNRKKRYIIGGYGWAWLFITNVQYLPLHIITLSPRCEDVETSQGVALSVTGAAQCKIMSKGDLLKSAAEQFLGMKLSMIRDTILRTLEGHLRAILGTLTVEEAYGDREAFAEQVREVAATDVGKMGIEILSFTIKDIYDNVGYLDSLGKSQIAAAKRNADIGVALAERDAGTRESQCERETMEVVYDMETKIENHARMFKLKKAMYDEEVFAARAEADLAYELQANKTQQNITIEQVQIDVVERRKEVEVEAQEVIRKELELTSIVRLPAEAESYRLQTIAEGEKTQVIEIATAEGERIRAVGTANAQVIESVGKAEGELMKAKAVVFKQYGQPAIMSMVLQTMPKIAAEVSAPLSKTQEIVILGGNERLTGEVTRLVGQIPPAVTAITGIDLNKVIGNVSRN